MKAAGNPVTAILAGVGLLAAVGAVTCGSGRGAGVTTVEARALAGTQTSARPAPAHLTKRHTGWRQVGCLECHDAESMAHHHENAAALKVPDCGRCHGYNGAPDAIHAVAINPCEACHATVAHASQFKSPADCIGCHAQSPQAAK